MHSTILVPHWLYLLAQSRPPSLIERTFAGDFQLLGIDGGEMAWFKPV
jgi:hypothetical protein